jgi:glyoxylase-like metal-dependent hydrolase (beta-lactamase superfamily II)
VSGADAEAVAAGVWVVRGGRPRLMNVYLIEDEGGLVVFDAGIRAMTHALIMAAARRGGIRRVVLGHADADHRGAAGGLGAPIYCHPEERSHAMSPSAFRYYWHLDQLKPWARPVYPALLRSWDSGALPIEGTVDEGDEIAGFKVIHLPGHAPGLIGLFREEDRLALASDCLYTLDPNTGFKGGPRTPLAALNHDTEQARASIRKLAELDPSVVWLGHARPITGDVAAQLAAAAAAA